MSDMDGQTAPTTEAPDAPQEQSVPDPVMARLDEMSQQISKMTAPPTPEPQGGLSESLANGFPEGDTAPEYDYGQGFDDTGYQPGQYAPDYGMDPQAQQQAAMAQLQSYISEQVQQGVQQQLTPHLQRQRANELERTYPELQDPQTAASVVREAAQWAQRMGRPELARDPELVELAFLAGKARQSAAQETPAAGEHGVHLESGGAAPQQSEEDAGDGILRAFGKDPANISW
jgi:hypothetical protein